jgi:hypothetical protein
MIRSMDDPAVSITGCRQVRVSTKDREYERTWIPMLYRSGFQVPSAVPSGLASTTV